MGVAALLFGINHFKNKILKLTVDSKDHSNLASNSSIEDTNH